MSALCLQFTCNHIFLFVCNSNINVLCLQNINTSSIERVFFAICAWLKCLKTNSNQVFLEVQPTRAKIDKENYLLFRVHHFHFLFGWSFPYEKVLMNVQWFFCCFEASSVFNCFCWPSTCNPCKKKIIERGNRLSVVVNIKKQKLLEVLLGNLLIIQHSKGFISCFEMEISAWQKLGKRWLTQVITK